MVQPLTNISGLKLEMKWYYQLLSQKEQKEKKKQADAEETQVETSEEV